jgi:hypothetical protein
VIEKNPPTSGLPPAQQSTPQTPFVSARGLDTGDAKRYQPHFVAVYASLGAILVAAAAAFVVLVIKPGHRQPSAWASWRPAPGSVTKMMSEIANHVSHEYKLSANGGQLVAVVPSKPSVTSGTTNISIKAIAIRKAPQSNAGIEVLDSNKSEMYTFCGLGDHCSISSGKPSTDRGRLVRREALEVALYTFKFVPSVNSVIEFMPPAPGATTSDLLFLRRENYKRELSRPLDDTLKLREPPLPTQSDTLEATTIDALTLPSIFTYELTALQTGGAALVLDPAT